MVRVRTRYVVDVVMLVAFIVCAVTGFILWYAFPSGGGGQWAVFLGVTKHTWVFIHDYSSVALTVTILIHFVINFTWILQVTKKLLKREPTT